MDRQHCEQVKRRTDPKTVIRSHRLRRAPIPHAKRCAPHLRAAMDVRNRRAWDVVTLKQRWGLAIQIFDNPLPAIGSQRARYDALSLRIRLKLGDDLSIASMLPEILQVQVHREVVQVTPAAIDR